MRSGPRRRTVEVRVSGAGRGPISAALVRRAVRLVLGRERAGPAAIDVALISGQRMRALNRRTFGRDRATDVIAFGMRHADIIVGDVYLCPSVARRSAARLRIPEREELIRLVVHGTLHVLGYDHPDGSRRGASAMWRRQERYVRALTGRAR